MTMLMRWLPLALLFLYSGCSTNSLTGGSGTSVDKPPFPRTKSILPLALNNQWVFSYTEYDSTGNKIIPNNLDLHLSVSQGYGLMGDSALVKVTYSNYTTAFSAYVYQYAWEEQKSGYLLVYRDLYPLAKRGLYVVGQYRDGEAILYPKEKLWLAYPADSGKTWQFPLDSADSSFSTIELLSTHARMYIPDAASMTGISFYDCYLYKETNADTAYYYYFNEHIGQLGYIEYVNGQLRVTYLLKSYAISQ